MKENETRGIVSLCIAMFLAGAVVKERCLIIGCATLDGAGADTIAMLASLLFGLLYLYNSKKVAQQGKKETRE